MMRSEYVLNRDEFARQIHLLLGEIYPEGRFDADLIVKMITYPVHGENEMAFQAAAYARMSGFDESELPERLFRELEIQIEKNLHDKYLFEISRDKNSIFFKARSGEKNG
jgi:hypothetical protein